MEDNHQLIKSYLNQGKKPDIDFRRKMKFISEEFNKTAEINLEEIQEQLHSSAVKKLEALSN